MIRLENVTKTYQTPEGSQTALHDITLDIAAGEIFGIIGVSGAGKSTLIRTMNLLEPPTSGHIVVNQQNLVALTPPQLRQARQHIGMIFQQFNLLSCKTAFENIALPLVLSGAKSEDIQTRVSELLALIGLADKAQYYPNQLSGGQKQRIAIARALAHNPKVLLCDECTSALDPQTTQSILELLKRINRHLNITIVLITHEMEVIKTIADRVAVIDSGKIAEVASVINFFKSPQTECGRQLIQSVLKEELPPSIKDKITPDHKTNSDPLCRIWFSGEASSKPLITELLHRFSVSVNILQANIEYIHGEPTGIMLAILTGEENSIAQSKHFLTENNIALEIVGYVSRNHFIIG